MKRLEQLLIQTLEVVLGFCFLTMFGLVVTQVALRYGLSESIGGANELATILFVYTSALGIAVGIAKREHMAISWFTERLPSAARQAVDVVVLLLLAAISCAVVWYSVKWIDLTGARMISVLQVPRWSAQIAIPAGAGASAIFCFIKLYLGLKRDEELGVPWVQKD